MSERPYNLFFRTLANKTRLEIIHTLKNGPQSVTEIRDALHYDQSTISHNLKRLERCKFVMVKKIGKQRIYSLNKETIEPLLKLIDKHVNKCCKSIANDNEE